MSSDVFERSVELPVSAEQAFAWHERPGALQRLSPPWEQVEIVHNDGSLRNGARTVVRVRIGPTWRRWVAEHRDYEPGRCFRDVQIEGPFGRWDHEHRFEPIDDYRCRLTDRIEYVPPAGRLGRLLGGHAIARKLSTMFAYRHRTLLKDLELHNRYADQPPLTVAVTGASGLVGSALTALLTTAGHRVRPMVRRETGDPAAIRWDAKTGVHDPQQLRDVDAIIHLAGENVAKRWTAARKKAFRDSRVEGTRNLVRSIEAVEPRPRILLTAAGMNYYGDRGDETVTEADASGQGFLAELVEDWEQAAVAAEPLGVRVARLRLGMVLSPRGGALAAMLTPFKLGGGGVLGSGEQYISWASIEDVIGAFYHALVNDSVTGPVNVGSPNPVTNRQFTKTLGRVLHRPTILPVPAPALRLAMGQMADEMLLVSIRMQPTRLLETGYSFRDADLETALRWQLGRGID